jgi:NTE family protein
VPLVLSPLTLKNYAGECAASSASPRVAATESIYLDSTERPFIHLVDGGLSDNLAVRWIIDNIALSGEMARPIERNGFRDVEKLVIINVDAEQGSNASLDRSDRVPSVYEVLDAVSSASLARRSRETKAILAGSIDRWRVRLRDAAGAGSRALSPSVELYVIDASLREYPEPKLRESLLAIPTAFALPADEVDKLVSAARRILRGSAEFDRLLRDLSATRRKIR